MSDVIVLGRDAVGTIAESEGMRYYLTDCCGASAKGMEDYVGCRGCYQEIDPALGAVADSDCLMIGGKIVWKPHPIDWVEVYGDGLPYAEWKKRYLNTVPLKGKDLR